MKLSQQLPDNQILTKNTKGEILYAIAWLLYESPGGEVKRADTEYLHAENRSHARMLFFAANPKSTWLHAQGRLVILEIGPVVGFHVHDNHGDVLSV